MPQTVNHLNFLSNQLKEMINQTSMPFFITNDQDEELCEYCHGIGKIATDVFDHDSGHYMQGVGESKKCICQYK